MDGDRVRISGNISNRPNSMAADSNHLAKGEYSLYDNIGPTDAKPGPTLLKQDAVALKFVSISKGCVHSNRKITKKRTMYSAK